MLATRGLFVPWLGLFALVGCGRDEGRLLDLSVDGAVIATIDASVSDGVEEIRSALATASIADRSVVGLKSRPNAKGQRYACMYEVKKSDVWHAFYEDTENEAGSARSLDDLRSVLADKLTWFVPHHREQNLASD